MKKFVMIICCAGSFSTAFGCFILFLTDGKSVMVANHEDWYTRDAEVTFIPPSAGKYGMVYFDFASEKTAQGGMNSEGLFFDGTKTPHAPFEDNAKKKDCHCYIWTKILEQCNTVDEAITYVEKYKIPEIEDIHVFFADRSGNSAVIGVYDNKLQVHRRKGNYQLLTNFNLSDPSYGGEEKCLRYKAADSMLQQDAAATIKNIENIMNQTHQEDLTIYSNVYNLTTKEVYIYSLYTRKNFRNKIKISLIDELKKGKHSIAIEKLFKQ